MELFQFRAWWELRGREWWGVGGGGEGGGGGQEEGAGQEIRVLSLPKQLPDCMR